MRTPAAVHFSTIATCHGTSNHSITASAMVGPTPSAAASCSSVAARMAAIEPNSWASARAALGPTCRIESATSTRQSGTSLRSPRLSSSRWPLALSCGPFSPFFGARVKSGAARSCSAVRSKTSPSLSTTPASSSAVAAS